MAASRRSARVVPMRPPARARACEVRRACRPAGDPAGRLDRPATIGGLQSAQPMIRRPTAATARPRPAERGRHRQRPSPRRCSTKSRGRPPRPAARRDRGPLRGRGRSPLVQVAGQHSSAAETPRLLRLCAETIRTREGIVARRPRQGRPVREAEAPGEHPVLRRSAHPDGAGRRHRDALGDGRRRRGRSADDALDVAPRELAQDAGPSVRHPPRRRGGPRSRRAPARGRPVPAALGEAEFRHLVEQSPVGTYVIQDERYRYANPKLAEILGYDAVRARTARRWRRSSSRRTGRRCLGRIRGQLSRRGTGGRTPSGPSARTGEIVRRRGP